MATDETFYPDAKAAITLHILLLRRWREVRFGVDRRDLLESALARPQQPPVTKTPTSRAKRQRSVSAWSRIIPGLAATNAPLLF